MYLGGYENGSLIGARTGMPWGFVGCVHRLSISGHPYDMRQGAFVGDALRGYDVCQYTLRKLIKIISLSSRFWHGYIDRKL